MRKEVPQRLLRELLKNSKRSDRELAKILNVSQPTITRTRHTLEKDGNIQDYTIIPKFDRMGFEILALTFVKMRTGVYSRKTMEVRHAEAKEYLAKLPNVILASSGEGLSMTGVIMSLHKDYTEYRGYLNRLRLDWRGGIGEMQSFIVSLKEGEFKRLSLTHLGDLPV